MVEIDKSNKEETNYSFWQDLFSLVGRAVLIGIFYAIYVVATGIIVTFIIIPHSVFVCYVGSFFKLYFWTSLAFVLSPFIFRLIIKKNWLRNTLTALLCFSIIFSFFFLMSIAMSSFKEFTTEKWADYPCERERMISDLTRKHTIEGLSSEEVVSLLGNPEKIDVNLNLYIYLCGTWNSYSVNVMEIYFENGKAVLVKQNKVRSNLLA